MSKELSATIDLFAKDLIKQMEKISKDRREMHLNMSTAAAYLTALCASRLREDLVPEYLMTHLNATVSCMNDIEEEESGTRPYNFSSKIEVMGEGGKDV